MVRRWAEGLPCGASVLDVGAGTGAPLTRALLRAGLDVHAIDASARMTRLFRARLPGVPIACEAAERSAFFGRTFDGVLAVGLVFLLPPDAQRALIARLTGALRPDGRLLLSAPTEAGRWTDALTGELSVSLGRDGYLAAFAAAGLILAAEHDDEGGNHYYEARVGLTEASPKARGSAR